MTREQAQRIADREHAEWYQASERLPVAEARDPDGTEVYINPYSGEELGPKDPEETVKDPAGFLQVLLAVIIAIIVASILVKLFHGRVQP